jgi:hypothetical protein
MNAWYTKLTEALGPGSCAFRFGIVQPTTQVVALFALALALSATRYLKKFGNERAREHHPPAQWPELNALALEQWQAVDAKDTSGDWFQARHFFICRRCSFVRAGWPHFSCRRLLCADLNTTLWCIMWDGQ